MSIFTSILRQLGIYIPSEHTLALTTSPPYPRSRTLTLLRPQFPEIAITGNEAVYLIQQPCLLISALPMELRDIVWAYTVGYNRIHMYWKSGSSLGGFVCARQRQCVSVSHAENRITKGGWDGPNVDLNGKQFDSTKGFMSLLLTCRAIYFEASKAMYSTSTFDFSDHWSNFRWLQWHIPLTSMSQIARVEMVCHGVSLPPANANFVTWKRTWEGLALLKGLVHLRVELVAPHDDSLAVTETLWTEAEDELLEPVECVKEVMDFVLVLPFPAKVNGTVARKLDCKIVRV